MMTHLNPDDLARVMAYVRLNPVASIREIGKATGFSVGAVHCLLNRLTELGYIEAEPGKSRARRVVVALIEKEKKPNV